jgi:hypothetical protein
LESAIRTELGLGLSATAVALRAHLVASQPDAAKLAKLEQALACVGLDGIASGTAAAPTAPDAPGERAGCCELSAR